MQCPVLGSLPRFIKTNKIKRLFMMSDSRLLMTEVCSECGDRETLLIGTVFI